MILEFRGDQNVLCRRMKRIVVLVALLFFAGCSPSKGDIRIEPQIGPYQPQQVQFDPASDDRLLAVEGNGTVSIWDVESKEPLRTLAIQTNASSASFILGQGLILIGGRDGRLSRWSIESGQELSSWEGHDDEV
ncbi:MAG TPA: hypothetical protein VKU40_12475, partial [Thermoanaerobaculia bacterium]|nr:hypothetical protein [Thermoanaerobaculia bacterium]